MDATPIDTAAMSQQLQDRFNERILERWADADPRVRCAFECVFETCVEYEIADPDDVHKILQPAVQVLLRRQAVALNYRIPRSAARGLKGT